MINISKISDLFFKSHKKMSYAKMLSGGIPLFSAFGSDIYASDVVQQALSGIVFELKKLNPMHVKGNGSDIITVDDHVQRVLENPNEHMTTTDFIEKISWSLLLNYNSFILPTYKVYVDNKNKEEKWMLTGLYPIQPMDVEFFEDANKKLFVSFSFPDNTKFECIPYDRIIHIKYRYSINEYMGGDENGKPNNQALLKTLKINENLLQGVSAAMKSSFAINGIVKYKTLLDDGKVEKAIKNLEEKLKLSESGFLGIDLGSEFVPIKKDIKMVDADTLKFIDEKILRTWGVPLSILTGDYNKEQYEAFYQKTLEPIITAISQAFSKGIFTRTQRNIGHKIMFCPKDLIFMSVTQTLEMVRLLGDSGALYENEKRVAFGLRPLPELEGVRKQSLNYIDVNLARQYQLTGGSENEKQNTD